ncbi:hypothetical protein PG991_014945 [Apiospora marii]|uniref:Uncharacterized protein n=1 Tax=Apiospora marii TaxID=335849 RepID=A0ABR1R4D0_9PEZI
MDPDDFDEVFQHMNFSAWGYSPENENFTHLNYTEANNSTGSDLVSFVEEEPCIEQDITAPTDEFHTTSGLMGCEPTEPMGYSQDQLATGLENWPEVPPLNLDSPGPINFGPGPVSDSLDHVNLLA